MPKRSRSAPKTVSKKTPTTTASKGAAAGKSPTHYTGSGADMSSSGSGRVRWYSRDPRTGQVIEYDDIAAATLESAYATGKQKCPVFIFDNEFTADFTAWKQINKQGGARDIWRELDRAYEVNELMDTLVHSRKKLLKLLKVIDDVDERIAEAAKNDADPKYPIAIATAEEKEAIMQIAHLILVYFHENKKYRSKYGFDQQEDEHLLNQLQPMKAVPNYFANVGGQSIFQRKVLSIAGLRNLVVVGEEILGEMRGALFSSRQEHYKHQQGPSKMRYYTGNAVDLDYIVLRCSDPSVLDAVNASHKKNGLPTFKDTKSFGESKDAKDMALRYGEELIAEFRRHFKLNDTDAEKRGLTWTNRIKVSIPVATDNSARGIAPVWQYRNAGQNSFHVNVPNLPDVYGALLKAPFYLARGFLLIFAKFAHDPEATEEWLDVFFEDGVSDTCFNMKWKALEEFAQSIDKHGSIVDMLNKLQAKNQKLFTPALFASDEDGSKEVELMMKLVEEGTVMGRDAKGRTRKITKADIKQWQEDPSVAI